MIYIDKSILEELEAKLNISNASVASIILKGNEVSRNKHTCDNGTMIYVLKLPENEAFSVDALILEDTYFCEAGETITVKIHGDNDMLTNLIVQGQKLI